MKISHGNILKFFYHHTVKRINKYNKVIPRLLISNNSLNDLNNDEL